MLRTTVLLVAVLGMGAAGCQSTSSPDSTGDPLADSRAITPIVHEVYTSLGEAARFVVRDPERWAEVWNRTFAGRSEIPQRPAIDFSTEMVLVAAQGAQGSSGYDISIDRVVSQDGAIAADVTATSPDERCGVLTVITSPVTMVSTPASDGPIQFIEHRRTVHCE